MTDPGQVGEGAHTFSWQEPWSRDQTHHNQESIGWAHHGIVVTSAGEVLTPHEDGQEMLVLSTNGELLRTWPLPVEQAHGMLLVVEEGIEYLWVADNGWRRTRQADGSYPLIKPSEPSRGAVIKYDLDGTEVFRLRVPPVDIYKSSHYAPTQVAVDEHRFGGKGDIWVADGYGAELVHRFDAQGTYLMTLDGEEGAGRYAGPHAVFIRRRGIDRELLVADRRNHRVQVYDTEGNFVRCFGEDYLITPSSFASWGDDLIIAELDGRLTVVGPNDDLIAYLGQDAAENRARDGWPNAQADGSTIRPAVHPGRFNSPHGLAVDADMNIYVAEFFIGGRLVKLSHSEGDKSSG